LDEAIAMTRDETLSKLISVRHYCYVEALKGHFQGGDGWREAFRTMNRLYVALRDRDS